MYKTERKPSKSSGDNKSNPKSPQSVTSAASQAESHKTAAGRVDKYLDRLLKAPYIEYKGKKALAVDEKDIDKLQDALEEAMVDPAKSSASDETLIALHEALASVRQEALIAKEAKEASLADLRRLQGDIKGLEDSLSAATALNQRKEAELKKVSDESKKALDAEKNRLAQAKQELNNQKKGYDPDAASTAQAKVKELQASITGIQAKLTTSNQLRDKTNAELKKTETELALLRAEASANKERLTALSKSAEATALEPGPRKVAPNQSAVLRLIGNKGLKWFTKVDEAARDDARERAYNLMLATKSSKDQTINGLSSLIEIVFNWLKEKAYRVRQKVAPWLEEINNDIKQGTIKGLKYYRESLEKLVGKINDKLSEIVPEFKETPKGSSKKYFFSWFEHFFNKSYGRYIAYPFKKLFGKGTLLRNGYNHTKGFFKKVYNYFIPEKLEESADLIYDAEFPPFPPVGKEKGKQKETGK